MSSEKEAVIITMASVKGGVGKTTLAVAVAAEMARRGNRVKLVELDSQGSALMHGSKLPARTGMHRIAVRDFSALEKNRSALSQQIAAESVGCDFMILDTPGHVYANAVQVALILADMVIMPLTPSSYDADATEQMLQVMEEVRGRNPGVRERVLVNRFKAGTRVGNAAAGFALGLPEPVQAFQTLVNDYTAFPESAIGDEGVYLWETRKGATAAKNIERLVDEIVADLKLTGEE